MGVFTYILILIFIFLCAVEYVFFYSSKGKKFGKVPGPYKLPILGNSLNVMTGPVQIFYVLRSFANKFKRIYALHVGHYRIVNIFNPDDVEIILSSPKHITKSVMYDFIHPWLNEGLLTSRGEKWHQRRKILTPAFHFNILKVFFKTFSERSEIFIDFIKSLESQTINVIPVITEFTINSICETAMGTQAISDTNTFNQYKDAMTEIGLLALERSVTFYLHSEAFFRLSSAYRRQKQVLKMLHGFTTSVIKQRRNEMESGEGIRILHEEDIENDDYIKSSKKRLAMLDLLLAAEADGKIDESGIREEVDTFMFEGHDTTASALCFCLMLLANNRDAQNKIVQELDEIFVDTKRAVTMEDLSNMKYLQMCIKESLRLYPSVHFISRAIEEEVKLSDYTIPVGTLCHIHIYDLHRDSTIYPCPDDFIPERFTVDNCSDRHPFAFVPFSAGPRNCIGQKFALLEMKTLVSSILRNFILEPVTKPNDIHLTADIILRSTEPIYVKFVPRNNENNQRKQNGNIVKF